MGWYVSEQHAKPSDLARRLVSGGYDLHVHVAPDVMPRAVDDLGLARRCREVGLAGFVLKSHYVPTAERASTAECACPGVRVFGAITLNNAVGGMNPVAVEIAGREGARVVWMPTVDSLNQRTSTAADPEGAKPPAWAALQAELNDQGIVSPPVLVLDEGGGVRDDVLAVLATIARHDMVLATGHLGRDEIFAVVDAALEVGVRRIVVTHPEFTSQRLSVDDQRALAERGALLERCFTTAHTRKVSWETMIDNIRGAGAEHSFLSSDLGQTFNPPVEDGLALMADRLLQAGLDETAIRTMAVDNTARLVER